MAHFSSSLPMALLTGTDRAPGLLKMTRLFYKSRTWPGNDFAGVDSKLIDQNFITDGIVGGNPVLLRHVYFSLRNGETGSWIKANERGEAAFPLQPVNTVSLVFEFCQERFTHFALQDPGHNYFEFRFEPWLMGSLL